MSSDFILKKEKELHEAFESRCLELERLLAVREQSLTESVNKFNHLRDDFQYNLTLLEARDNEIVRLSGVVKAANNNLLVKENEIKSLSQKIELLHLKDSENSKNQEKQQQYIKVTNISLFIYIFL